MVKNKKNEAAPVTQTEAPAVTETAAQTEAPKRKRGNPLNAESRAKGAESRRTRALVNDYLRRVGKSSNGTGVLADKRAVRLAEIVALLKAGKRVKAVPLFQVVDGVRSRTGTERRECDLNPMERAELLTEKRSLEAQSVARVARSGSELRSQILAVLPAFAKKNGYDYATLQAIGFSDADLKDAGISR